MVSRYLEVSKVGLSAMAPQFVEPGHCFWCNKPLTGKAKKYCAATQEDLLWANGRFSECYIYFNNWWYSRPAYQRAVFIRDKFTCQRCGHHQVLKDRPWLPDFSELHCDHILPISRGGLTELTNLQILCAKCNLEKGAKMPVEEKEPGIPSYKISLKGYPRGKCPTCRNNSYLLLTWSPPDGLDDQMLQVRCRRCLQEYYMIPLFIHRRRNDETHQRSNQEDRDPLGAGLRVGGLC